MSKWVKAVKQSAFYPTDVDAGIDKWVEMAEQLRDHIGNSEDPQFPEIDEALDKAYGAAVILDTELKKIQTLLRKGREKGARSKLTGTSNTRSDESQCSKCGVELKEWQGGYTNDSELLCDKCLEESL
jgi:hypothetical protein